MKREMCAQCGKLKPCHPYEGKPVCHACRKFLKARAYERAWGARRWNEEVLRKDIVLAERIKPRLPNDHRSSWRSYI